MMMLGEERGCRCEICNLGIWIKQMKEQQSIPDYLVLYHKDGDKGNTNFNNISLRCVYCSKFPEIKKEAFLQPARKQINKNHGNAGCVWYNNGLMSKFVRPHEIELFEKMGWQKGRIRDYREPPSSKGKIFITNGIINRFVDPDKPFPEGWWKGKTHHGHRIRNEKYKRL